MTGPNKNGRIKCDACYTSELFPFMDIQTDEVARLSQTTLPLDVQLSILQGSPSYSFTSIHLYIHEYDLGLKDLVHMVTLYTRQSGLFSECNRHVLSTVDDHIELQLNLETRSNHMRCEFQS